MDSTIIKKEKAFLKDFYLSSIDKLYDNSFLREEVLKHAVTLGQDSHNLSEYELFKKTLTGCLEEAELTLSLLQNLTLSKESTILEVGSGMGFAFGFLKQKGFNVYAIEPSGAGFGGYFDIATQMLKTMNIDSTNYYPFSITECHKLNQQFDIIFSNNVLEHVTDLRQSFLSLKHILKPSGLMVHNTVNYSIPYEPHFKIILVPFFPKITAFFKPSLKKSSLWNGLNFITTKKLKDIGRACGLKIEFQKGVMLKAFHRFETDPEFAKRQKFLKPIYRLLKRTRLINIFNWIPISLTTPIWFTVRK